LHYTNAEFAVSSRTDRTYRRDGMPKDPTKNVDRYKVRGGVIDEYEYHENQQVLAKDGPQKGTQNTKTKKPATNNTVRGASAKKLAARKAAKK